MEKYKQVWSNILILVVCSYIFAGLATDALKGEALFEGWVPTKYSPIFNNILYKIITTAVFLYLLYRVGYRIRQIGESFLQVQTLSRFECIPRPHIIVPLSSPQESNVKTFNQFPFDLELKKNNQLIRLTGEIDTDIELMKGWNWQQLFRSLRHHRGVLQSVCLISSSGSGGSCSYSETAERLIRSYFPEVTLEVFPESVDFEDLEVMINSFHSAIKRITKEGHRQSSIIIESTFGTKITSIAAASVTMDRENENVAFQYIQTREPYKAVEYNVVVRQKSES